MSEETMELSPINSDGPELSCQYIDGVINRFPETKNTMEYIRTINSQLRYDANGYKEIYLEITSQLEALKKENERLSSDLHLLTKTDKLTLIRIEDPVNAYYQQCFKENTETITDLKSKLTEALKENEELKLNLADRSEKYKIAMDKGVDILDWKLKEAIKALEFYGDFKNITSMEFAHPKMKDRSDPEVGHFVRHDDFEYIDKELAFVHGKLARETLTKLRGGV